MSISKLRYAFLFVTLLWQGQALAVEKIRSYHSDIMVNRDGSVTVTEIIRVNAEGTDIRRGIYRDFPTTYWDHHGNRHRAEFHLLDVQRNGVSEDFHTENLSNGIRVYIGSAQKMLPHGEHEYRLLYRSTRQLGYFDDFDELYWNVTGNGWMFPIDQASALIELPQTVEWKNLKTSVYTGFQGENASNAESRITSAQTVEFKTTAPLQARQGLTVALAWPKGIVPEPGTAQRIAWFFKDNGVALILLLGFLLPLAWYYWAWNRHGRDPEKGVIIPRFKPPKGLSAAACPFVMDMSLGRTAFTAAIISLGVKGYLKIDDKDGDYTLYREKGPRVDTATAGESAIMIELLPGRHFLD